MKKLMILSTGGTIACTQTAAGLVSTLTAQDILSHIPQPAEGIALHAKTIFNLDSSNIQPEEWKVIAREVFGCLSDYDGVVVLHGTDTMAYTASMLSFMCAIRASRSSSRFQLPVTHPETDAKRNLQHAILAACSRLKGVPRRVRRQNHAREPRGQSAQHQLQRV
jgi:L-asparaginase